MTGKKLGRRVYRNSSMKPEALTYLKNLANRGVRAKKIYKACIERFGRHRGLNLGAVQDIAFAVAERTKKMRERKRREFRILLKRSGCRLPEKIEEALEKYISNSISKGSHIPTSSLIIIVDTLAKNWETHKTYREILIEVNDRIKTIFPNRNKANEDTLKRIAKKIFSDKAFKERRIRIGRNAKGKGGARIPYQDRYPEVYSEINRLIEQRIVFPKDIRRMLIEALGNKGNLDRYAIREMRDQILRQKRESNFNK